MKERIDHERLLRARRGLLRGRLLLTDSRPPFEAAGTAPNARHPAGALIPSNPKDEMTEKPTVLFVCVHNAGRSQMAAAYLTALAGDEIDVRSAGSEPAGSLNQVVVAAMAEDGIDITSSAPRMLDVGDVREADVVITMGCGDACPVFPGKRYEDWVLDDPAGLELEAVRPIRDSIRDRVRALARQLQGGRVV
jgi:protein-tyrosine-phosphatase